jgi:ribosomal protein L37AE/L43A
MIHSVSRPQTSVALLDDEADAGQAVTCPMCHAGASLTRSALDAGGAWRCVRCGQDWDARRLTGVAAYALWVADHDRADRRSTEPGRDAAQYRDPATGRVDGTP